MNTKEREQINFPEGFELLPKPIQDFICQVLKRLECLEAENAELRTENAVLRAENIELRSRLSKNSSNSNSPPSTDQYARKSKPKSEREKSGKKTGGQPGHIGSTLQPTQQPDAIKNHDVSQCYSCQHDLSEVQATGYISRQEYDIPPIKPIITEHRMASKICPKCKSMNTARGSEELTQPIQFGSRIKTLATYLHYAQLIPLQRIQDMFWDLFSLPISEGTLVNMHEKLDEQLEGTAETIQKNLQQSAVVHFDETSMYINGKTHWLHVASNDSATGYFIHPKRGTIAMDAMAILPKYQGIAVHDHWKPYFTYELASHSLCNAHHLRELRGIFENYGLPWAQDMRELLLHMNYTVNEHKEAGKSELPVELIKKFSTTYDHILQAAQFQIPNNHPVKQSKKSGPIKQHPAKNLYDRLTQKKQETLRFMHDFRVPFTNNQGERDIRMAKVKQKISGCFRSPEGADRFCRITGYISTSKKQGINVFQALENATRGEPVAFPSVI